MYKTCMVNLFLIKSMAQTQYQALPEGSLKIIYSHSNGNFLTFEISWSFKLSLILVMTDSNLTDMLFIPLSGIPA